MGGIYVSPLGYFKIAHRKKGEIKLSAKKILLIVLGVLALLMLFAGSAIYSGYNQVITLDEDVKSKWAQVENQLQRRFELIPNIVATVKGITGQEEKIFLGIAEARKAYFTAPSIGEKARAAGGFEAALSRLLVLQETYPELKSNQSFLKLQDQLEGTENRLAVERQRYNDAVKELNTFTRKLLGRFYATLAGVEKGSYFEVGEEARTAPKVAFN
jgi:LemA protein